jgi:hypothetical protein
VGFFCNFHVTAKDKQLPIGRKFAQSGHPACLVSADGETAFFNKFHSENFSFNITLQKLVFWQIFQAGLPDFHEIIYQNNRKLYQNGGKL